MSQSADYNLIRLNARKRLLAGLPAQRPPLGPENRLLDKPYLDPLKPVWIKESVFRGTQVREASGFLVCRPLIVYAVRCWQGTGTTEVDEWASKIAAIFEPSKGTILYSGTRYMNIERTWQGDAFLDNDTQRAGEAESVWYGVPVNVACRLHIDMLSPNP